RCLLALVNEGAKILEENIAANSRDIDLVYLNGYGFPAERGGPMSWADGEGIAAIHRRLLQLTERFGSHWQPAPLIERLVAENKHFSDVQEGRV
ncbi:MAG TPA: 3-hydroxyacyl-CoA dehydrogenase family protein, partial [Pseudomonas sp.]|nr:3-hydroxyacyl-CoA dehydrogenase family protein [Pseudomonas sp.]